MPATLRGKQQRKKIASGLLPLHPSFGAQVPSRGCKEIMLPQCCLCKKFPWLCCITVLVHLVSQLDSSCALFEFLCCLLSPVLKTLQRAAAFLREVKGPQPGKPLVTIRCVYIPGLT
uniref:Uncharacterized protein n=1 Tax=Anolis carolinensis TaxID=28377 RepID=A0A803TNT4_ANOCA